MALAPDLVASLKGANPKEVLNEMMREDRLKIGHRWTLRMRRSLARQKTR